MDIICIIPMIPKIGYTIFTRFANPNRDIGIASVHIITFIVLYIFLLSLLIFSKKLYPSEIAVVNIAISMFILYKILYSPPNLFATHWYFYWFI